MHRLRIYDLLLVGMLDIDGSHALSRAQVRSTLFSVAADRSQRAFLCGARAPLYLTRSRCASGIAPTSLLRARRSLHSLLSRREPEVMRSLLNGDTAALPFCGCASAPLIDRFEPLCARLYVYGSLGEQGSRAVS
jgi:hypothetical protein